MDEVNLENRLNELVNEFGGATDPKYKKLAILARQARRATNASKKALVVFRNLWTIYASASSISFLILKQHAERTSI